MCAVRRGSRDGLRGRGAHSGACLVEADDAEADRAVNRKRRGHAKVIWRRNLEGRGRRQRSPYALAQIPSCADPGRHLLARESAQELARLTHGKGHRRPVTSSPPASTVSRTAPAGRVGWDVEDEDGRGDPPSAVSRRRAESAAPARLEKRLSRTSSSDHQSPVMAVHRRESVVLERREYRRVGGITRPGSSSPAG